MCAYFSAAWGLSALFVLSEFRVQSIKYPLQALIFSDDAGIYHVVPDGVIHQGQADFRLSVFDLVD